MGGRAYVSRPRYTRAHRPPPMRFQERDGAILWAIYDYDGVLARRHLKAIFWPGTGWRAMERRLSLLFHNGYLDWPNKDQRRTKPVPESIVWLGWRGALWLAGQNNIDIEPPKNEGENQQRKLARELRKHGFYWQREPRWNQLAHDLAVVDFRLSVERACSQIPAFDLENWIPEGVFRSDVDVVEYRVEGKGGRVREGKKGVCPDSYFAIVQKGQNAEVVARYRLLLELDMASHSNPKFGRDKIAPGLAYIKSSAYKTRFGDNSGRWLVVTSGERRMMNLKHQADTTIGQAASVFYFTTLDKVRPETVLTSRIWYQGGDDNPSQLLIPDHPILT